MSINFETDLILITCASGKQASALLPIIHGKWKRLRLMVHSEVSSKRLQEQYPNAEVVQADMVNPHDTQRIMKGVSVVSHVGPSAHPHEAQCGYNMIDAAVEESNMGNFKHFIFSSVFPTQIQKLMNHDCKRHVEEYLMESGLNHTILQPSHFFENTPVAMLMQQENPVYPMAYNPAIKFSFTALKDMADVTALVLEQRERHYFAVYPIISTMPVPYTELLEVLGKVMGKPIRVEQKSLEDAIAFMKQRFGIGEDPRREDIFERLLLYYNRRGLWGNPSVTEWLLQRKATSCEEWAKLQVASVDFGKS